MQTPQNTPTTESHHWVDKLSRDILAWQQAKHIDHLHVDDMKTPSGRVHTGALRGVMIHDIVAKALQQSSDQKVKSTYVFNDMDSMDGLPAYLEKSEYEQHMGKALYKIPAPPLEKSGIDFSHVSEEEKREFENCKNFAEFYALDFIKAFRKLGSSQEIVWSHELYESGQMDETIRFVLDHAQELKKIYEEVAEYTLPPQWYPFQAICPQCGKQGTTLTTGWDGSEITFECQPNKVKWAVGCGYTGKISPFGGNGKLLWKVDWPSHWRVMGVTVEGAGKDHTSAGGSRDMADAMCKKVFHIPTPYDIPYEWILIRGAKMSSSKGVGTSAREFVELFPAEVGRFLFVNKLYSQVIDFDPRTMTIPDLFDDYDLGARIYWGQEEGDNRLARSFEVSQLGEVPTPHFLPRFRDVATWMQYPEMTLEEKFAEVKGSPLTSQEKVVLEQRKRHAQIWIQRYAPEDFQLSAKEILPAEAEQLTAEQKNFFVEVHTFLDQHAEMPADELQQHIFEMAKQSVSPRKGFEAIYLAYLGKKAGPRAAWFLKSLAPEFRRKRVAELTAGTSSDTSQHIFPTLSRSEIFSIGTAAKEKFPSVKIGVAIIKNVRIQKTHPDLEIEKASLLDQLKGLTTEEIGKMPEILSYRRLFKEIGIDWHSRRPSPEALLRRIAQGKDLYQVNTCVDAYNLVVMKHHVSVGVFDLDTVAFPTNLDLAQGNEEILLLGDQEPTKIKAGEMCYFDKTGPFNLDFNYRDAQRTMVREETTNLFVNVDGVYDISRAQVEQSLQETIELIQKYSGGEVELLEVAE